MTLNDARRAGLCPPGIRAWWNRHFGERDIEDGAHVSEIIGIADQRSLVLAAAYVAIKRHKLHLQEVAQAA